MSKGSPIITMRINDIDLSRIDQAIKSTNRKRRFAPYTRSSWIMAAIQDRLDHIARSKKSKSKARRPPSPPV